MRDNLIKIGAYLILILGVLTVIAFAVLSIYIFVFYPQALAQKRVLVGTGSLIAGVVTLVISIALFEAMIDLVRIEKKVDPSSDDLEKGKNDNNG